MREVYRILLVCGLVCWGGGVVAQTFEEYKKRVEQDFATYKAEEWRKFKEYRDRVNAEFAEYMRQAWTKREAEPAIPVPERPEPPKPVVKDPKRQPEYEPLPFDGVIPAPKVVPVPQPEVPLPDVVAPKRRPTFSFQFYGTPCRVSLAEEHRFTLKGTDENSVADAWAFLSSDSYFPVFVECVKLRSDLQLCDWGYVRLVERMSEAFFPAERRNEARLLQMYLLTQSGYKVRIARTGEQLALLLPSKDEIYEYSYLNLKGEKYYVIDPSLRQSSFHVFEREFPEERLFSLQIPSHPLLNVAPSEPRRLVSRRYPDVSVEVTENRNLMAFYDDYPQSNAWDVYVRASLDEEVKEVLYPVLRKAIAGKSKPEAANVLINFVQTAFDYQTDQEQFGGERALFPDETLYYPYSDCEDRAILYSVLVRELLGLDVVLLHYPGHLATAVCFGDDVPGDYFALEGRRYVVCDPTYINAGIGESMPQYKTTKAEIIRVN
ncbi:hypothetical protein [Odoribacter lunatus]|uniref:hypothetical protein n=1 Tax=Odoribacter lunatus TaxID=2941335 RepID=UPI002041B03A|nr:hypothetical protein [Odoribacter lunatus]